MPRLQTFYISLIKIIEDYHHHQCGDVILVSTTTSADHTQIEDEKETSDLAALITLATKNNKKRLSLLTYLLHATRLLKPYVTENVILEEDAVTTTHTLLTHLMIDLQRLFKTSAPNQITVNYTNEDILICGLINAFIDGGRICTSGELIKKTLFPALFPYLESPLDASEDYIKQTITDILNEHQLTCIRPLYRFVLDTNATLTGEICSRGQRIRELENDLIKLRHGGLSETNQSRTNPPNLISGLGFGFGYGLGLGARRLLPTTASLTEPSQVKPHGFNDSEDDDEGETEVTRISSAVFGVG